LRNAQRHLLQRSRVCSLSSSYSRFLLLYSDFLVSDALSAEAPTDPHLFPELRGELADYNMLVDKLRSDADLEAIVKVL
jgi:hypothetical protein